LFQGSVQRVARNPSTLTPVSLCMRCPQMPAIMLGDVVISLDTAARQAQERGYTLIDEARVLLVHGVLHLLGYDHEEGRATSIYL
jgi:rRNA maturation RNase YbeY